ncbi:MAG: KH domain-containing protein [Methanomicrobiales archaeon]|nr:KH domain-containing protein [Methanomicrobiales archaeon]
MTTQEIKVAGDRLGVLIGKGGATKRDIEEKTHATIRVDSKEGMVIVEGEDAQGVIGAVKVVEAINRGFSPERAFQLLRDEDLVLDIIDLSAVVDTPRQLERVRGRIIGRAGRSREQIEDMTGTSISVHGKTISIIGEFEQVKTARTAVEMLVNGVPHETVYSFLDKKKREAKQDLMGSYY